MLQVVAEGGWRADAVVEDGGVDVHTGEIDAVAGVLVPGVLDPEDREALLGGQVARELSGSVAFAVALRYRARTRCPASRTLRPRCRSRS